MAPKNKSSEDYVTLMIIPHGRSGTQSLQVRLPYLTRRQILAICSVVAGILLCMMTYSLLATYRLVSIARLLVEHRTQVQKLNDYREQTEQLQSKLAQVHDKASQLRGALGLATEQPLEAVRPSEKAELRWQREQNNVSPAARSTVEELNMKFFSLQSATDQELATYSNLAQFASGEPQRLAGLPSIWPVSGPVFSRFGFRIDPVSHRHAFHTGFDISAQYGTPVHATASGTIEKAGWDAGGFGYMVKINHGFGLSTVYGHNSRLLVKVGDPVRRGQVIALVGSTGMSTGTHCHYEVQRFGHAISPATFLNMNVLTGSVAI